MEMINLRWTKGAGFPQRVGNGKIWYCDYAGVTHPIEVESFDRGFAVIFFLMDRINWVVRRNAGRS